MCQLHVYIADDTEIVQRKFIWCTNQYFDSDCDTRNSKWQPTNYLLSWRLSNMGIGLQISQLTSSPFYKRRRELSIIDGRLLWGIRVVIPEIFYKPLLKELYCSHLEILVKLRWMAIKGKLTLIISSLVRTFSDTFNDAGNTPPPDTLSHQDDDKVPMSMVDCEPYKASTDANHI